MSKVFACLCALMLLVSVGATAEVVNFVAVDSQASSGLVSYTAAVTGGFAITEVSWDGFASTINAGTYGSELTCAISGPLGAAVVTLGSGSTYSPGAAFSGSDVSFVGDPAGVWTFDFYETYDDGGDVLPDATWDNIDFTFAAPAVNDACFIADSQASVGVASYTASITGGFAMASLDWSGIAETINAGTYGSELTCDISGPLGAQTITLGSGATYSPSAAFAGSTALFVGDPAGVWTFDFYETYDDGGDSLPDATWNDICFTFAAPDPCSGPDTCADAAIMGSIGAGAYAGDTTDCTDDSSICNLWGWSLLGLDHVYAIDVPCSGAEICVTYTPGGAQDGAIYLTNNCVDADVLDAVAGADSTLGGEVEAFCYTTTATDAATMYLYVDSYGAGSAGAYTLDIEVNTIANDTCATAIDVSAGGSFLGTTICAANDYDGVGCNPYTAAAPDAVYSITVADGDNVDLVYTPLSGQDISFYVVGDCGDLAGSCQGGADSGLGGDPEYLNIDFECAGTYYIICDGWSTAEGDFQLDVVVTPGAAPVDTFDVSMVCDIDPLNLPTQTKIRVYVTNTTGDFRQFCGSVGVTLCDATYIGNIRAGSMVLAGGATQFIGWGQVIPALNKTCNCTLVFDVDATDCTPCTDTNGIPAGWNETASCGITTVCP